MTAVNEAFWDEILAQVRNNHPSLARAWFEQLVFAGMDHGVVEVQTSNVAQHQYLLNYCTAAFNQAAQAATGRLVTVRFVPPDQPAPTASPLSFEVETENATLNPDYVFDHFVVGPCNQLAHAACVAAGESPGRAYNPLFIHGDSGLGKTHLLQAACHRIRERYPDPRIVYLSCETFNNHFIEAISRNALHQFRQRYRHVDVLVIDDVQFLAGREQSQEEFFHTFNTLYQAQKQIILSADTPPKDIAGIEERLISRFNWGLVARIDRPCLETRIAILKRKAQVRCVDLPDDVVYFIASAIDSNTRELEGAITKVNAVAHQYLRPIDMDIARMALGDDTTIRSNDVSVPQILDAVVREYNVRLSDLQGKKRSKSIAFARQVCMYLAREMTPLSLEEIGKCFGGRDHTTVLHATRTIRELRQKQPELDRTLTRLAEELRRR